MIAILLFSVGIGWGGDLSRLHPRVKPGTI
jgi:hypothetical protein